MRDNTLYYYSHAEFLVMLAMSGIDNCAVGIPETEPDDAALTQAIVSLYHRGLLRRDGNRLVPDGAGLQFSSFRDVKTVVLLHALLPHERVAICYLLAEYMWMAERLDEGIRIQKMDREDMCAWLFDAGVLEPPVMRSQDLTEATELYRDELGQPQGECLLRMEKQQNGDGRLIKEYQVLRGPGIDVLQTWDGICSHAEFSSVETLSVFLSDCFSD